MSQNKNVYDFRIQPSAQPRPLLPGVRVHKRPRQQIQQQLQQQQQIQQQLQQRALSQAGAESEAICPLTELFSSSQIQSQHQLWEIKQHNCSHPAKTIEEGRYQCKMISVKRSRPKASQSRHVQSLNQTRAMPLCMNIKRMLNTKY